MSKTILITGSTDGIGKLCAKKLVAQGHRVLLHGRNPTKLASVAEEVGGQNESYVADLWRMSEVEALADSVLERHSHLDVLINNAGVLKARETRTAQGLDVRFVVNTIAPYVLTRRLLSIIPEKGRIVNLSSAAQAPVDPAAMAGHVELGDMEAYSQSKLAITAWTQELAKEFPSGPVMVAVNPGSLLASKMVKEGFGIAGNDLSIGADILCRAALDDSFASATGKYFDNDAGRFAPAHAAIENSDHVAAIMQTLGELVASLKS